MTTDKSQISDLAHQSPQQFTPRAMPHLALPVALFGLLLFLLLTGLVLNDNLARFDETLLLAFRNPLDLADPIGPRWFEHAMDDITALGGTVVLTLVTLLTLCGLLILRHKNSAFILLGSVPGGYLLSQALKAIIARPRPDIVPHAVETASLAFPSGHAMMAAIVWLTIGAILARLAPTPAFRIFILGCAAILSFLIGVSRIYLGVHWPSDVLAGWALGTAWAIGVWSLMRRPQQS